MSKRKGVSAEEKRIRILQLFHEKKDFFQLKELEKIAPKEKGIIPQSVKDVVQSLVDDGLVDTDKIGSSIYYWAYPGKALHTKRRKLQEIQQKHDDLTLKLNNFKKELVTVKQGRENCSERTKTLERIAQLNQVRKELETKLKSHSDCNAETLKDDIKKAKDAINCWTDNIYAVKTWCKQKFMIDLDVLDKQFEIPSDLDYVE